MDVSSSSQSVPTAQSITSRGEAPQINTDHTLLYKALGLECTQEYEQGLFTWYHKENTC